MNQTRKECLVKRQAIPTISLDRIPLFLPMADFAPEVNAVAAARSRRTHQRSTSLAEQISLTNIRPKFAWADVPAIDHALIIQYAIA